MFALTEGFSQFMVPFVMSGGSSGGFTRAYGVGAVVDFTAFDLQGMATPPRSFAN